MNTEEVHGPYDSHLEKITWEPSERLHAWNARRLLDHFSSTAELAQGTRLLEVGTGVGRVARAALDRGWRYEGVEPTTALAHAARAGIPGLVVHDASLPELPSSLSGRFDATVALHVLEHAPNQYEARAWLNSLKHTLVAGGHLLIASPDIRDYRAAFWDSDWSHGWPTTPYRVAELVKDVGLEPIRVGTMRLGRVSAWNWLAFAAGGLLPTRPLDALSRRYVARPLATGAKIALTWGLTFVVGRRPA